MEVICENKPEGSNTIHHTTASPGTYTTLYNRDCSLAAHALPSLLISNHFPGSYPLRYFWYCASPSLSPNQWRTINYWIGMS